MRFLEGGCPSHHLWLRAPGEPRGLLLLSLAWLAAGQAFRATGGCPGGETKPTDPRPPLPVLQVV